MAPPMDMRAFDDSGMERPTNRDFNGGFAPEAPKFPTNTPTTEPSPFGNLDTSEIDEATSIASLDGIAAMERARHQGNNDERTRAVNIRNDPSISDIDWDLD